MLPSPPLSVESPPHAVESTSAAPGRPAPIASAERIEIVDILRGVALFGILCVNMALFRGPMLGPTQVSDQWPALPDRAADWLVHALAEGKFYTLFSFLFGFGLAIQMLRASAAGRGWRWTFVRRLAVLLLIGCIHAACIWPGDILVTYALLGLVLMLFAHCRPMTLVVWAAIFYSIWAAALPCLTLLEKIFGTSGDQGTVDQFVATQIQNYTSSSWMVVTRQRVSDWGIVLTILLITFPSILAQFLLGLAAGKVNFFASSPELPGRFRLLAWIGLAIGLPLNIAYATLSAVAGTDVVLWLIGTACLGLGAPILCFGYVGLVGMLAQSRRGRWLDALAPVGRMALTNYLMQSLLCTTIFYGYGLGWYDQVSPAAALGIVLAVYLLEILWSSWWLARFRFGPAEWVWRSATYLKWQPMRSDEVRTLSSER